MTEPPPNTETNDTSRFSRTFYILLASGGGVGFSPVAPGTLGGLIGLGLAILLAGVPSLMLKGAIILLICLVGIPLCGRAARLLGGDDPRPVVWDEIASVPITFFFVPAALMGNLWVLAIGFMLNRALDVLKPPPIRQAERLHGGLGIMADDLLAGLISMLLLTALVWLDPWGWQTG